MGCNGGREMSLFEVESRSRGPAEPYRSPTVAIETDCFEAFSPFVGVKKRLLLCEAMPDRLPL